MHGTGLFVLEQCVIMIDILMASCFSSEINVIKNLPAWLVASDLCQQRHYITFFSLFKPQLARYSALQNHFMTKAERDLDITTLLFDTPISQNIKTTE